MSTPTSLLCPVDFSPASLGGLHYALAIGSKFHLPVTVLAVEDPLLASAGDIRMGGGWTHRTSDRELHNFVAGAGGAEGCELTYEVRVGKAAPFILEVASEHRSGLIVMSTHGLSGLRKWVLGATAERVLRETTIPVLLTPADPGPLAFDDLVRRASPILVPVDFGCATAHQVDAAGRIADAFHLKLMIGHVLEPVRPLLWGDIDQGELLNERQRRACRGLQSVAARARLSQPPDMLVGSGDPSEEIARWIHEKQIGMLVMALQEAIGGAPRMGSVTYRSLVLGRVLTLALPPMQPS
ncbi:MAG TPA: universal stress protein [Vicinamibacterales bacterium]